MEAVLERMDFNGASCCEEALPREKAPYAVSGNAPDELRSFIMRVTGSDFLGGGGMILK